MTRRKPSQVVHQAALMAVLGTWLSACDRPPVVASQDPRQRTLTTRIDGTVLFQGRARGNATIFLFDTSVPSPQPVSFSFITGAELFGSALNEPEVSGPFTAPFSFSLVASGRYRIGGFLDVDECMFSPSTDCRKADFNPWYSATAEPNMGDILGGAIDIGTKQMRILDVNAGPQIPAITGVTVTFPNEGRVPYDRPVFEVNANFAKPDGALAQLELRTVPVRDGPIDHRDPKFVVRWMDENGDGAVDLDRFTQTPRFWPKVIIRKLSESNPLKDENDLNEDGRVDPTGEDYEHVGDTAPDGKPDLVVLPVLLTEESNLNSVTPPIKSPDGRRLMDVVGTTRTLNLIILARAIDVSDPSAPALLKQPPKGRYSITVIQPTTVLSQSTIQTWRVPNELHPELAPLYGLPGVESQRYTFEIR